MAQANDCLEFPPTNGLLMKRSAAGGSYRMLTVSFTVKLITVPLFRMT